MKHKKETIIKILSSYPKERWEDDGWWSVMNWNFNQAPPMKTDDLKVIFDEVVNEMKQEDSDENPPINLVSQEENVKTQKEKRIPISFENLEKVINKWLLIKDKGLLRILLASVIANKLKADPVWLFIVAAPGGTKTELIRGLNKIDGIYPISDLTPQTFISGEKGNKSASLLLRLPPEGTILTYKDFTTVLTMHRDKQQAIISQLREIFDGSYRKEFGTGETKDWQGKIGFIAGVTAAIDRHHEIYSVLGERFIQYRPLQPDGVAVAKKAIENSGGEKIMREEIQNAFVDFITSVKIPKEPVLILDELKDRIAHLATFVVKARSGIIRDGYSTREIELIPDSELPTRLAKQLITLASALSFMGTDNPDKDYELIYKIGMDSLPIKRRKIIEILIGKSDYVETSEVAIEIDYPTNTTRRALEDLSGLGLVLRKHEGQGIPDKWMLNDYTRELLGKAKPNGFKGEDFSVLADTGGLPEKSNDPVEINKLFGEVNKGTLPETL